MADHVLVWALNLQCIRANAAASCAARARHTHHGPAVPLWLVTEKQSETMCVRKKSVERSARSMAKLVFSIKMDRYAPPLLGAAWKETEL